MNKAMRWSALAAILIAAGMSTSGAAPVGKSDVAPQASSDELSDARRGGARGGGGGRAMNRNVNVNRNVNRRANVNVNRNVNVRRTNVNVRGGANVVVRRPVRVWAPRPYFGTIVGGVALGTIIAATAVPAAPGPNTCWFWADSTQARGYWDYCQTP